MEQSSSSLTDTVDSSITEDSKKSKQDSDELTDTLNAFLTSSLNVELVYTILKGIRRIVKTPDLGSTKFGQEKQHAKDRSSIHLTLESIKIRSFKMWEDALQ